MYKTACFFAIPLYTFVPMSLFIASLNSGSNGNCYYIGNKNEAILVDVGISCRAMEKRMKHLGLDLSLVKAVFISHEHSDHISGLGSLLKRQRIPLYVSEKTFQFCGVEYDMTEINHFSNGDTIAVGNMNISVFSKIHDAIDPYSFCVEENGIYVGVITDIGRCGDNVVKWFSKCHAAFLEANYDEEMLNDGPYPFYLKRRIAGGLGHLSNDQALKLFKEHRPGYMSHLILSHLSKTNNSPEIVESLFERDCGDVQIVVAPRTEETNLFEIDGTGNGMSGKISQDWVQTVLSFNNKA